MMNMPEPFSWNHLNQWNLGPLAIALLVGAHVLYCIGVRRVENWPRIRIVAFSAGIVITFLATQSVIGVYDMSRHAAHMIQHLLLIMVAAPLFAFAAPLELLQRAIPASERLLHSAPMRIVLHPIVGFALYAVFIPASHLSGLFDLMLRSMWFHHFEQIAFLVSGYLFFRHAIGVENESELHPGLRLVYVMAAVPVDTVTGLALAMSSHNPFPSYLNSMRSPNEILSDIHLGGAIMWIGGDALMLLLLIPLVVRWLKFETIRTKQIDAELDELGL
jgi:cytochrome c oxidase assembly factor CtaG